MKRALEVAVEAVIGMTIGLVLGAICAGCATLPKGRVYPREHQEQAVHVVWHDTYHREDMPPAVHWVEGTELDCQSDNGVRGFKIVGTDACLGGLTMTPLSVYVALPPGAFFGDTSLAHEMAHVYQLRSGVLDPLHRTGAVWGQGGLVEQANVALGKAGL